MMWKKLTENNCHEWKLSTAVDPMKGNTGVRFVKHEASQPSEGALLMWVMLLHIQ